MEYIEHERTLSAALNDPSLGIDEPHILNPNIAEQKLEFLYGQMANILLQLSTLTFPRIGSLDQDADGQISVSGRPLTMNMNNVVEFTNNIPLSILPTQPQNYSTTTEWYSALADTHLTQLAFQHNDVFRDEEDMRDKYVARQLFRRLAREGCLTSPPDANKLPQFRIFSGDLRPSNVLVDANDRVVGVIDWEFAYAAPAQFTFDPAWWLLLTSANYWLGGYEPSMEAYEPRLATFLRVLEAEEAREGGDAGVASAMEALTLEGGGAVTLSQRMRRSWEDRTWMISLAARDSWAFDFMFWRYLDRRFFGESEDWDYHARLELLTERERDAMEPFVAVKMEEDKERVLVEWDEERAAARLAEVMV